ncbi:MAG: energy transducer TonB [Candidatus Solibacter sp.]
MASGPSPSPDSGDESSALVLRRPTEEPAVPQDAGYDAGYYDAGVAAGIFPVAIKYSAIRELRAGNTADSDGAIGVIFGAYATGARIESCVRLPVQAEFRASQVQNEEAVIRFMEAVRLTSPEATLEPIGLFRIQSGSWPSMTEADCELVRRCMSVAPPRRPIFVLIRTFLHRPWTSGVFLPDHNRPASWKVPALEFPFDEYLLKNGFLDTFSAAPLSPSEAVPDSEPKPFRKYAIPAGVVGGVVLLGAALISWFQPSWIPYPAPSTHSAAPADAAGSTALDLRAVRIGDYFDVTWNRRTTMIEQSVEGVLRIQEGGVDRSIQLTPSQLREGHILYQSSSGDLNFRLAVTDGVRSEAQSVRVLESTRIDPSGQAGRAGGISGNPLSATDIHSTQPLPAASMATVPPVPVKQTNPQLSAEAANSLKGEAAVSVLMSVSELGEVTLARVSASTGSPSDRNDLAVASVIAAKQWKFRPGTLNGKAAPSEYTAHFTFGPGAPSRLADPKAASPSGVPAKPPAPRETVKVTPQEGNFEAPLLVARKAVSYPEWARQQGIKGVAKVSATIGTDGHTKDLVTIANNALLGNAASNAVRQWVYKPAKLDGVTVESKIEISIDFGGEN